MYTAALSVRLKKKSCLDHIFVLHNVSRISNQRKEHIFCAFIDFKMRFILLIEISLDNLTQIGINGFSTRSKPCMIMLSAVCNSIICPQNGLMWRGVRRGDSISPTIFYIFLNYLTTEIIQLDAGITSGGTNISLQLYVDDIVLMAPTPEKLYLMLYTTVEWCDSNGVCKSMTRKPKLCMFETTKCP